MSPMLADSRLDELLSAMDTDLATEGDSSPWSEEVSRVCRDRLAKGPLEARLGLIRRLGQARDPQPVALLIERLPAVVDAREAETILQALNDAKAKVPADQIQRFLPCVPAVVAAGLSGDGRWVESLEALLDEPKVAYHAALGLALLGSWQSVPAIARRIAVNTGLLARGLIVALEVMKASESVPLLRDYLVQGDKEKAWDLAHALWRLTGREPLVPLPTRGGNFPGDVVSAWSSFDLSSPARPRCENLVCDAVKETATFQVVDGKGALRVDFDPPIPGSAWPRWDLSLYLGEDRIYAIGSTCGTCETTLRLLGFSADRAALSASGIRAEVADAVTMDRLIPALSPLLANLRTGHYVARLVDWDLERVTVPERSWLTRRWLHRMGSNASVAEPNSVQWPGTEHFQVLRPGLARVPTYGVVLPTAPFARLHPATVDAFAEGIAKGRRPVAILMGWVEQRDVEAGAYTERFLVNTVLDGHHKLAAYQKQGVPARCLVIARVEDCAGPDGDPAVWLHEALDDLRNPVAE